MKTTFPSLLIIALVAAGCTQNGTQNPRSRTARTDDSQDPRNYRMLTGSHVPQPTDRPYFQNLSANAPYDSSAREGFSLAPTEPIVGAGSQSLYRQNEPSTGAGPEGGPTVRGASGSTVPGSTPAPHAKATRQAKPKATPTPTPR